MKQKWEFSYRFSLYLILAVLVVGDSIMLGMVIGGGEQPLHPAVLGETVQPVTIRGEPAVAAKSLVAPVPTKDVALQNVTAKSFLVYDADSKIVLAEKGSTEKLAIASLTKLMTALIVYNTARLDEVTTIFDRDRVSESPVLGLQSGDQVKIGDLFNSMLIGSANDAALALSHWVERTSSSAFPILMNNTARQLGMFETNFSNPLGFDSQNNYSSAHDLALLVDATQRFTAFQLLGRSTSYEFTGLGGKHYSILATNKLIAADPELVAIKTGFTLEAQGTMITAATHNSHTIIIIVLGSSDRERDTLLLKHQVFEAYVWKPN